MPMVFNMISVIIERLCVGDQLDAEAPPPFITAILWTALDPRISPPANRVFARLPLKEYTEPDLIDLQAGVEWLARHLSEHHILVACRAGLGRSPSIIIAYLCCIQHLSYEKALQLITEKRPGSTPLPHLDSIIEQMKKKNLAIRCPTH